MLKLISENPFRVLNIYCNNSVAKAEVKNSSRHAAYSSILGDLESSAKKRNEAKQLLQNEEDKSRYSLFWFMDMKTKSEPLAKMLEQGDVDGAEAYLESLPASKGKRHNQAICHLLKDNYNEALKTVESNDGEAAAMVFIDAIAAETGSELLRKKIRSPKWKAHLQGKSSIIDDNDEYPFILIKWIIDQGAINRSKSYYTDLASKVSSFVKFRDSRNSDKEKYDDFSNNLGNILLSEAQKIVCDSESSFDYKLKLLKAASKAFKDNSSGTLCKDSVEKTESQRESFIEERDQREKTILKETRLRDKSILDFYNQNKEIVKKIIDASYDFDPIIVAIQVEKSKFIFDEDSDQAVYKDWSSYSAKRINRKIKNEKRIPLFRERSSRQAMKAVYKYINTTVALLKQIEPQNELPDKGTELFEVINENLNAMLYRAIPFFPARDATEGIHYNTDSNAFKYIAGCFKNRLFFEKCELIRGKFRPFGLNLEIPELTKGYSPNYSLEIGCLAVVAGIIATIILCNINF